MKIGGRAHSVAEAARVAQTGVAFVEISLVRSYDGFCAGELAALQEIRDTWNITYLGHGPEEGDPWDVERLRTTMLPRICGVVDCACVLGAPLVTVHFWLDPRFIDAATVVHKVAMLREMAAYAAGRGVLLCVENLSERAADFLPAFDASGDLAMTLDIGHAELLAPHNRSYAFLQQCPGRIRHVHIHDNRGGDGPEDDLHLPLGRGSIDLAGILAALQEHGYDRTITMEVSPEHLDEGRRFIEAVWNQERCL